MSDHLQIVAFVKDVFFGSRIDGTAAAVKRKAMVIDRPQDLPFGGKVDVEEVGRAGPLGASQFLEWLKQLNPGLVIFELDAEWIPWESWIMALKADPETAGITVVAFGSHKDLERFKAARAAGADRVMAKSSFVTALPELIPG